MLTKQEMFQIFKQDVQPALGCTEPVCVSLAVADATKAVGGNVKQVKVVVNPNIYKNGMSVGIPGFDKVGLDYAAAIGALLANPHKKMQLLEDLTPQISNKVKELVDSKVINVTIDQSKTSLYVKCDVTTDKGVGTTVIENSHTNIVLTQVDGKDIFKQEQVATSGGGNPLLDKLKQMSIAQIRQLVESASFDELAFLLDGIKMNDAVAQQTIEVAQGIGIAKTFKQNIGSDLLQNDLMTRIMMKVASSIEGRLDGGLYTIMCSASAGSKGLAVILPVSETAKQVGADDYTTAKALAFAHLVNSYINLHIGKLSAMCACGMAASTAASVGITYLMGGNDEQIAYAIRNMTGTITGMICDGGKVGCALKLATASASAFVSAMLAINGVAVRPSDGVCAVSAEDCIKNMGRVANPGMAQTDKEILQIMLEK